MRRANAQLQSDRRAEILAAAQRCFVRSGFHGASMQEICAEAGMSPGNLYRYFRSKEALMAGIAERDRAEVAQQFARADLSRGLFAVLEGLAAAATVRGYPRGTHLFHENHENRQLMIVWLGRVALDMQVPGRESKIGRAHV